MVSVPMKKEFYPNDGVAAIPLVFDAGFVFPSVHFEALAKLHDPKLVFYNFKPLKDLPPSWLSRSSHQ